MTKCRNSDCWYSVKSGDCCCNPHLRGGIGDCEVLESYNRKHPVGTIIVKRHCGNCRNLLCGNTKSKNKMAIINAVCWTPKKKPVQRGKK